jgi:hypothetical protein
MRALALRVLLGPFLQGRVLLLLRQLEMFLAEEPESRSFRPVLATRVVAAHVEFTAAQFASYAISATASSSGNSESSGDALRENLSEPVDQRIEWVGRTSGHGGSYDRCELTAQLTLPTNVIENSFVTLIRKSAWRICGGTSPQEAAPDEQTETEEGSQ